MSSIASETNSVQTTHTNGNEKPNVDQKSQKNQTEELHIVDEATSNTGEQSESRQSGAEHPREEKSSEEQGYCKTAQAEHSSKYHYGTFDGYTGERYLQEIVKDILPTALARTWAAAVSYQAPGKSCYVGTGRLAQRERLRERTIQKDLQALRRRGLLNAYGSWTSQKQADGSWSLRAIVVKDFSKLYDLAYEYHLWMNNEGYIPAEREYADLIRGNKELYNKLVRFNNYRRILCCEKPGRKEQLTALEKHHQQYEQEHYHEYYGHEECDTNKHMSKQSNNYSPYRESKDSQESLIIERIEDSRKDSEGRVLGVFVTQGAFYAEEHVAIRNEHYTEQDVNKRKEEEQEQKKNESIRGEETEQVEDSQRLKKAPETAKDAEECDIQDLLKNPFMMAEMLANEYNEQKKHEEATSKKRQKQAQRRARRRRGTPEQLALTAAQMVQQLGGNPKFQQSDLTRISKIYWTCTQSYANFRNGWFLNLLNEIFIRTCKARKAKNRISYFFTCLENELGFTTQERAYLRSSEPLYTDGDLQAFIHQLQQRYERSNSPLDYEQWITQNYRC